MTTSANLPATRPAISIAGFKNVYHVPRVEEALSGLQDLGAGASDALKSTYVKMIKAGGQRFSIKPSALPDIDALVEELPNFEAPLEDIRRQLALCLSSDDPLDLEPMLLLGDPGIGKTHFARRVAKLLGTGYSFIGMSSLTAGWILSGASAQWKNAKPGKVFEALVHGDYANPVIVVDEIDKAGGDAQYDPSTTRSAACTRCSSTTPRASSSTSSPRCRSTPRKWSGSPPPTRRVRSPSRS